MLDYIRAELYKVTRRRYLYIFMLVMLACEGLLVAGWAFTNANGNNVGFDFGVSMLASLLTVGLYCTILVGDLVFSEQYKFNTMKNEVSYGVPRTRIFLGKLIVQCLVALALCAVFVAAYVAMCWLFLPHDPAADAAAMQAVGFILLTALPLWLGAQALVNMIFFLIKSSTVGSFLVVGIFVGVGQIFQLMSMLLRGSAGQVFYGLYRVMLTTPLDLVRSAVGDWAFFGQTAAIGVCWFVLATGVGLVVYRKKEIS